MTWFAEADSDIAHQILLHQEISIKGNRKESMELIFEMNFDTGKWRKIRRVHDYGLVQQPVVVD